MVRTSLSGNTDRLPPPDPSPTHLLASVSMYVAIGGGVDRLAGPMRAQRARNCDFGFVCLVCVPRPPPDVPALFGGVKREKSGTVGRKVRRRGDHM